MSESFMLTLPVDRLWGYQAVLHLTGLSMRLALPLDLRPPAFSAPGTLSWKTALPQTGGLGRTVWGCFSKEARNLSPSQARSTAAFAL